MPESMVVLSYSTMLERSKEPPAAMQWFRYVTLIGQAGLLLLPINNLAPFISATGLNLHSRPFRP